MLDDKNIFFFLTNVFHFKDRLKEEVENGVKECRHSLFIIDDIHTMPDGVLDVLKPYLKNHQQLDGIDYRKTIFLFLR